jgi:tRNA dimethylallyltransferase
MTSPPNLIAVCGPNASGKTRLSVALARRYGGEVISVDSRQVYRGLDIGSGKDLSEYRDDEHPVPYHLIDIADPADTYTLWNFQQDFYRVFTDIGARGALAVASGGTGLYLEAVLRDYQIPNVPEDPAFRAELMEQDMGSLEARLVAEAPHIAGKTDRSTKKRIVRALEVARAERAGALERGQQEAPEVRAVVLAVRWPREELRKRIRERLDRRLRSGMVDEVVRLRESGLSDERLDLFGLEYRHIMRHLRGEKTLKEMTEELYVDICRFAKRQETYFRGMERRGTVVHWIPEGNFADACAVIEQTLPMP